MYLMYRKAHIVVTRRHQTLLMLVYDTHTCTHMLPQTETLTHTQIAPVASSCSLSGWSEWRSIGGKYVHTCSAWPLDPLSFCCLTHRHRHANWSQSGPDTMASLGDGLDLLVLPLGILWHWSLWHLTQNSSRLYTWLTSLLSYLSLVLVIVTSDRSLTYMPRRWAQTPTLPTADTKTPAVTHGPYTSCWHLNLHTHMYMQNRDSLPSGQESEVEFNEKIGQTVLTRCRGWSDEHTDQPCLHMAVPFYSLTFLFSHTWPSSNHLSPSLSPPLVPLLNIPS